MDQLPTFGEKSSSISYPDPPTPWTPADVLWGMMMAVLIIVLMFLSSGLVQYLNLAIDTSFVVVFGTLFLLWPVWYLTIYKYGTTWADLGLRQFHPKSLLLGCGLMLFSIIFNLVYGSFLALFDTQMQPGIEEIFENTRHPLVLLFGGIVVAPIVEEIFFRGFIFTGLRQRWGWPKAAVGSALIFALAHVVPTSILPIFILGFIFALLYQFSGSIWPAIFMHMLTNAFTLLLLYALSQGLITPPEEITLSFIMQYF